MSRRIGSVCSGVDGLTLGLEWAGVGHTVWHAEVDPDASRVLAERWPGVPNHGDITTCDWGGVSPIDILVGGYPCQPFSVAGDRRGADDERHLWPAVFDALRVLRPPLALFENVAGHVSLGLDSVLADLASIGFDAWWGLVRASDVGAPHRRARLFLVAADAAGPHRGWRGPGLEVGGQGGSGWPDAGNGDRPAAADTAEPRPSRRLRPGQGLAEPARHDPAERPGAAAAHANGERCIGSREPQPPGEQGACRRLADGPGADGWFDEAAERAADADADSLRRGPLDELHAEGQPLVGRDGTIDWGPYAGAIERWERILGRPAPAPVDERERLSPIFVEWMQGYPEGFVTDIIARRPALRALGNTVVPQVAALIGRQIPVLV